MSDGGDRGGLGMVTVGSEAEVVCVSACVCDWGGCLSVCFPGGRCPPKVHPMPPPK